MVVRRQDTKCRRRLPLRGVNLVPAYACEIVEGVIMIFDRSNIERTRSVTNAIDWAVAEVAVEVGSLRDRPVIYRDSEGVFDGIAHANDRFVAFYPIGERVLEPALTAARRTGARSAVPAA